MLLLTLCSFMLAINIQAQVTCGGPVFLTGDDADDHGNEATYAGIFDQIMANVSNGQTGILAIGTSFGSDVSDWIETVSANMISPQAVSYVSGAGISSVNFNNYAILFIPSDEADIPFGDGISQAENTLLVARAGAIATFINSGGGLFGNTQGTLTDAYGYLASVGSFTVTIVPSSGQIPGTTELFDNVSATSEGSALGITALNLDHCCFHNVFNTYPSFMLELATANEPNGPLVDGESTIIGGVGICVSGNCPLSQGYWKNHPDDWPASALPMLLGTTNSYTKSELLDILNMPIKGDASLILARQLIAAKLNLANGSDPTPVSATISDADALIGAASIPMGIKPNSATGQLMTSYAGVLDDYNNGNLTPSCIDGSSAKRGMTSVVNTDYSLSQNLPNPFVDITTIKYFVPVTTQIKIAVYDITGKQVAVLFDGIQSAGHHTAFLSTEGTNGKAIPAGVYIYTLESNDITLQQKMIIQQ